MEYINQEENKVEGNDNENNNNKKNNIHNEDNTKVNENNSNDNNNELNNDNDNKNNNDNNNDNNDNNNNNNNNGNIDNNININDNNIGNRNMIDKDIDEEKRLINSYKEYLSQAEKTIDTLFLIKTKKDFLQMVRDKATEFEEVNKTMRIIKRFQGKNRQSKINISKSVVIAKDNESSELEYYAEDNESSKDKEIQDKIFRTYMNAERRKMEKFINNEREGKFIRNKES